MNTNVHLAFFLVCAILFGCNTQAPLRQEVAKEFAKPYQVMRIDSLPELTARAADWRHDAEGDYIVLGEWYVRESKTNDLFRLSSLNNGEWVENFDQLSVWLASTTSNDTSTYNLFGDGLFPKALIRVTDYRPEEGADIKLMLTINTSVELTDDTLRIHAFASTKK